jgi:YegS/Rv2252/BmrU family lipid kinase
MDTRRAALVFNPASGRGGAEAAALRAALEPHFELRVYETCLPDDGPVACARRALADGATLVLAAGGDGTVSAVASALLGSEIPLGILPRGTANSIAGALGIPDDLEGAVRNLIEGEVRLLDTAHANGQTMVLHASVGLHAATIGDTSQQSKNRWGVLAYVATAIDKLRELEPFQVEIETDAEIVRCRATNVTAANLAPPRTVFAQGPATISPEDGALDLTIVAASTLTEAVATGFHLLRTARRGEAASRDDVGYLTARRVQITATPPQPVLIDGEEAGVTPLLLACLPASLRVIVPRTLSIAKEPEEKLEGLPELEVEDKR